MDLELLWRASWALGIVLLLMAVIVVVVRRLGLGGIVAQKRAGQRRLQIVEVLPIDPRRKLLLLRWDEAEHLLLLGQGRDLLVSSASAPSVKNAGTSQE